MKNSTNIFITIDYELFMGAKSGTVNNCIIDPTELLEKLLGQYNIKMTIFVDAAYLFRLYELSKKHNGLEIDFNKITKQLLNLAHKKHEIQLHLHPQWWFSDYHNNEWVVDKNTYKLSDIEENLACKLFKSSKEFLEEVINKPINSFRAGGYSLQSFSHLKKVFLDNGIRIDSSVLANKKYFSYQQFYDYTQINGLKHYNFNCDITNPDIKGVFIELPITTIKLNLIDFIYSKMRIQRNQNISIFGDGKAIEGKNFERGFFPKLKRIIFNNYQAASIDHYGSFYLNSVYKEFIKLGGKDFCIIGHPKNLSNMSFTELSNLINYSKDDSKFISISSLISDDRL